MSCQRNVGNFTHSRVNMCVYEFNYQLSDGEGKLFERRPHRWFKAISVDFTANINFHRQLRALMFNIKGLGDKRNILGVIFVNLRSRNKQLRLPITKKSFEQVTRRGKKNSENWVFVLKCFDYDRRWWVLAPISCYTIIWCR